MSSRGGVGVAGVPDGAVKLALGEPVREIARGYNVIDSTISWLTDAGLKRPLVPARYIKRYKQLVIIMTPPTAGEACHA
jgi:hypothetical protein